VSRETLVLALATPAGRERFASDPRLADALRAGLDRAIDDADRAGAIPGIVAGPLHDAVAELPVAGVIEALRGGGSLLDALGGAIGPLGRLFGGG
jgi:hypothetical protein